MARKNSIFNTVAMASVPSNTFDMSHDKKLSFQMGELVPTASMEVLPGDKWTISVENMLRFAPLISPVMHQVKVTTHFFFVPNRILWPTWEDWITSDSTSPHPQIRFEEGMQPAEGTIFDYLGYPTETIVSELTVNPFPAAAYLKIYDEYYRDQNLVTEKFTPLIDGDNTLIYNGDGYYDDPPLKRAWMHDYFTSALPFAQKGTAVQLPITEANNVPVDFISGNDLGITGAETFIKVPQTGADLTNVTGFTTDANGKLLGSAPGATNAAYDPNGHLVVDIQAGTTTINVLRRAFKLQEWLEKNARGGTRYIEHTLSHFGVKGSDARLQRPEYLGGAKQNMVISEVLSTAETDVDTSNLPVGTMAGHGISVGGGKKFSFTAEEHGWIIGIINVQPVTAYQTGLHRSLSRIDQLDYAWPTFANIGEQEIKNKELFIGISNDEKEETFGYVPRYSEYKFMNSSVAGEMKSSLNFWHLARNFTSKPVLNSSFINADPSTRIFAVTEPTADHIYGHCYTKAFVNRKLPRYGIPSL